MIIIRKIIIELLLKFKDRNKTLITITFKMNYLFVKGVISMKVEIIYNNKEI